MKRLVQQARSLGGAVAGAVRRAVDPPLTADARPIDIRRAIVEAVEQRLEPAGQGRRVLPGEVVQVTLLAEQAGQRKALEAVLLDLTGAVRDRLLELQCSVPRRFTVDVRYVRRLPAEWAADQRLAVALDDVDRETAAGTPRGSAATVPRASAATITRQPRGAGAALPPPLTIQVIRGQAGKRQFTFTERVIRVGRSSDPTDDRGKPRQNDVAFLENDGPENSTVTRGHAVIRFDGRIGEYRLFDEGSANGTRILRSGEAIDVPKRDPVGVSLRSGDEIQFGKAAVKITLT
jgi:hypothetical protein